MVSSAAFADSMEASGVVAVKAGLRRGLALSAVLVGAGTLAVPTSALRTCTRQIVWRHGAPGWSMQSWCNSGTYS